MAPALLQATDISQPTGTSASADTLCARVAQADAHAKFYAAQAARTGVITQGQSRVQGPLCPSYVCNWRSKVPTLLQWSLYRFKKDQSLPCFVLGKRPIHRSATAAPSPPRHRSSGSLPMVQDTPRAEVLSDSTFDSSYCSTVYDLYNTE